MAGESLNRQNLFVFVCKCEFFNVFNVLRISIKARFKVLGSSCLQNGQLLLLVQQVVEPVWLNFFVGFVFLLVVDVWAHFQLKMLSSFILISKPEIIALEFKFGLSVSFFDHLFVPVFEFFNFLLNVLLPPIVKGGLYLVLKNLLLLTDLIPVIEGSIVLDIACAYGGLNRWVQMRFFYFLNQFCLHPSLLNQFGVLFSVVVVQAPLEHVGDQITLVFRLWHNSSKVKLLTHDCDVLHVCAKVFAGEFVNELRISNSFHQVSIKGRFFPLPIVVFLPDLSLCFFYHLWRYWIFSQVDCLCIYKTLISLWFFVFWINFYCFRFFGIP